MIRSMVYRRERPKIRKAIEQLMSDFGWDAQELYDFTQYEHSDPESTVPLCLTTSFRVQLRKMIEEEQGRPF